MMVVGKQTTITRTYLMGSVILGPLTNKRSQSGLLIGFQKLSCTATMAARLPPPKRQKLYHGIEKPEPEAPRAVPSIVVQFVSEEDGKPLAPAVNIPADVSREGLEALVNKLSPQVRETRLYRFP